MNKSTLYADLTLRQLTTATGGVVALPLHTFGDEVRFGLKFNRRIDDAVRDVSGSVNLVNARGAIGLLETAPTSGRFTLSVDAVPTAALRVNLTGVEMAAALGAAEAELVRVGLWMVRFAADTTLAVVANTLEPRAYVRLREVTRAGQTWHEIRLLQMPVSWANTFERVLPDGPSVRRIRAGSPRVEGSSVNTNEVQAIRVPVEFRGTYYLTFDYRATAVLGEDDGPDEIAAALNGLYTDELVRFLVTNPEDENAYVEFVGELGEASQSLLGVVVNTFQPGDPTLTFSLATAELANLLRRWADPAPLPLLLEIELEIAESDEEDAPTSLLTLQRVALLIAGEIIYPELASVPAIDWVRPPSPRSYIPFDPSQVITGVQHFAEVVGDGVVDEWTIDHGLATEELHVTVRENSVGGRRLRDDEYVVTYDSANAVTLLFDDVPDMDGLAVLISSAGPASAFQDHSHEIGDVTGLQDFINNTGTRLGAIEDLLPAVQPSISSLSSEEAAEIEIPDFAEIFPKGPTLTGGTVDVAALRRPGGLLPAIHDSTAIAATVPLEAASAHSGEVVFNDTGDRLLVPGGLGTRGSYVEDGEFLGSDGRRWYPLAQEGVTNSYFPTDFERELFMLHVNDSMLTAGGRLDCEFLLETQTFKASSRAQWLLQIEVGSAPGQATPDPAGTNLSDVAWIATPLLSQRIVLSGNKVTHRFGCSVRRLIDGTTMEADRQLYGKWYGGAQAPAAANFTIRARLVQFDTENSVADARGYIFYHLKEAKAAVINS